MQQESDMRAIKSWFAIPPKPPVVERRVCPPMSRLTYYAMIFSLVTILWGGFRYLEPSIYPVISDFSIVDLEVEDQSSLRIWGTFEKRRSCEFIDVIAYSKGQLIRVDFERFDGSPDINRLARIQAFGPWRFTPKTQQLEIYARHRCYTGIVLSELFNGVITI